MATTCSTNKTLAIVGSGANTVAGNLIYKLGGIDLPVLARLQEKGINSYDMAAQELKDTSEELYFYTPRYRVTVKDQVSSADGLLLVVTPSLLASDTFFTGSTVNELKESAPLFVKGKAIILVKIPENHNWSESLYNDLVRSVRSALQHLGISAESTPLVPSDPQGGNLIELSPKTPWHTDATLVVAMDKILS